MEAVAKYDFKATADDELSFKRGDILKVKIAFQVVGSLRFPRQGRGRWVVKLRSPSYI
uniref:SH3 domain-containing protein n=1 Tax=Laticauda laticaudata TaxID=8630 RepID=A0A8C5WSL1_LATLA